MKKEIKEKLTIFLFILMIILGIGVILYPVISNQLNKVNYQEVIDSYQNTVTKQKNSQNEELIEEAREYNRSLTSLDITDVFQDPNRESSHEYLSILNIEKNGMMGYISIPKIDVRIPIYHGTNSDVLQKGVGHLEGSSFPVGGENTHAILSAHRGLPSSRLFTDLDQLEVGDTFYIYILDQVFAYQVDQVQVIEPSETDPLRIVEGGDYVTLVTCTPYAINTHRLLVRGERIEYNREVEENIAVDRSLSTSDIVLYGSLLIAIVLIVIAVIFIIHYNKKKGKNRQSLSDNHSTNIPVQENVTPISRGIYDQEQSYVDNAVRSAYQRGEVDSTSLEESMKKDDNSLDDVRDFDDSSSLSSTISVEDESKNKDEEDNNIEII